MTATATVPEITIEDVGPIHSLRIPLPAGGGLVVLRGRNDAGKSEALKSVNALVSGNGGIEKRDGSVRGEIRLGEARMTVVKQTRRDGPELEAVTLDGRLSLADLVDPGLVDAEKADAVRIKALVQLVGVTPDIGIFHPLAGRSDDFAAIVGPDAAEADDIVTMAARVKRHFEAAARKAEDEAENLHGQAVGHRESAVGFDPSIESDAGKLQAALEMAIRTAQKLESECEAARKQNGAIADARQAMAKAAEGSAFPTVARAKDDESQMRAFAIQAADDVRNLEDALSEARKTLAAHEARAALATKTREAAEQHERTLAAWAETARLSELTEPTADADAARESVNAARLAVETGAVQRDKAGRSAKADAAEKDSLEARRKSERLRDAAKGTEEILSGLVGQCGTNLRVERGRLVTDHKRGTIPYSDLSDGTRWKMAIDIGIEALARQGRPKDLMLFTIPQVAFSELQPKNRMAIHKHLQERGVHALTAMATDDEEITAEPMTA